MNWFDNMFGHWAPWLTKIATVSASIVITLMIVGLCCMPIIRGYVMKTVGVTQMPVRYDAHMVLYDSQISIDPESTTEEDRMWRPIPPTAAGLTL